MSSNQRLETPIGKTPSQSPLSLTLLECKDYAVWARAMDLMLQKLLTDYGRTVQGYSMVSGNLSLASRVSDLTLT